MKTMKTIVYFTSIICLSQAVKFNCTFSIWHSSIIAEVYNCSPTVHASESGTVLENVTGTHHSFKTNADVEYLNISRQNLSYVPSNIETFFPNLKAIEYYNSNLGNVSAKDLRPFPPLLIFAVGGGLITTLDGDLFKYTPNLKWIEFNNNTIEHIGENLLGNLTALQYVFFWENTCIDTDASDRDAIAELNRQLPILCPRVTKRT